MARMAIIDPETAEGKTKDLLATVQKDLGSTPNLTRVMANSPAALSCFLELRAAAASTSLSPQLREKIALTVSSIHDCQYCLAAHSYIGSKLGLGTDEIKEAIHGVTKDAKDGAILSLAKDLVLLRGSIGDDTLASVRNAGVSDEEMSETLTLVILHTFANYFNQVAQTPIDFPAVTA